MNGIKCEIFYSEGEWSSPFEVRPIVVGCFEKRRNSSIIEEKTSLMFFVAMLITTDLLKMLMEMYSFTMHLFYGARLVK